ncbi:DUF536 domain-containing protein [Streptococcus anginosus]|jgi:hypothetical protein|uniref:DUF536 domain-containing protein n=1 Tax=Streptococcus anginosus TaxID=1328 RepID=A0A2T0FYD3_STRAP|nr:DUF536 domain-containing protein [Streptococcus anginosus]PRT68802.1 DUF536 domain-containing protein [Streptococcus anginosus]
MSKTIKEIADELCVSKTAIRNKMTDDFRSKWVQTSITNGVQTLVITEEGVNILKSMFRSGNHTANLGANKPQTEAVSNAFYEQQILKQLEQIEILQKLLDQQQQLLLNEQKKSQIFLENKENKQEKTPLYFEERFRQLSENNQHYLEMLRKSKWHQLLLSILAVLLILIVVVLTFLLLAR